jgi:Chloroplast envelope transporter
MHTDSLRLCAFLSLSILQLEEPTELTPDAVAAVGARYGINMQRDQLQGLQKLYGQYLEAVIPVGDTQLM